MDDRNHNKQKKTQGCDNHPGQISKKRDPTNGTNTENSDSLRVLIQKDNHSKDIGTIKNNLHEGTMGS
jgi:hypothetical protein